MILDAALRLFSQKGFLGATTRQIAREAGVAEVTLFRRFGSKEELFAEVIRGYSFLPAMKGSCRSWNRRATRKRCSQSRGDSWRPWTIAAT
jgi:AcrR family transcriptional regulator